MRQNNSAWCFYVGQFAQFTLRAYWLVLCIPRSDDAPACQVALSNARGACLLLATNRNADSIASTALTKCVSGKAMSHPGSRDFGIIGSKTTSRDQTFACTCARLICSNHAPWVRVNLSNPCPCFISLKGATRRFSHV